MRCTCAAASAAREKGQLHALRVCRLVQRGLHAVKGVDIGQLEGQRFLAGKAHGQQRKAVAGQAVGSCRNRSAIQRTGAAFLCLRKIAEMVFIELQAQVVDSAQHIVMAFAKVACQICAEDGGLAVNDGDGGRNSQCGLRHRRSLLRLECLAGAFLRAANEVAGRLRT